MTLINTNTIKKDSNREIALFLINDLRQRGAEIAEGGEGIFEIAGTEKVASLYSEDERATMTEASFNGFDYNRADAMTGQLTHTVGQMLQDISQKVYFRIFS